MPAVCRNHSLVNPGSVVDDIKYLVEVACQTFSNHDIEGLLTENSNTNLPEHTEQR